MKLAMQCPGCFSVSFHLQPGPDQYIECDCGEGLRVIDLREQEEAKPSVDGEERR